MPALLPRLPCLRLVPGVRTPHRTAHAATVFRGGAPTRAQAINMLAKNALALRRATPVGHRCMSALVTNVDALAAQAAKMEKILPESLKPLASGMVRLRHSLPSCTRAGLQRTPQASPLAPTHRNNGACRFSVPWAGSAVHADYRRVCARSPHSPPKSRPRLLPARSCTS